MFRSVAYKNMQTKTIVSVIAMAAGFVGTVAAEPVAGSEIRLLNQVPGKCSLHSPASVPSETIAELSRTADPLYISAVSHEGSHSTF
jgi:hypothetical protein